jgi:plasmid maintenance system antidote protein VapI
MPLDAELIKMRMQCANVNVAQLAEISGIAANKLSLFVNGTRGIRNDEITRLRETLAEVEELIEIAQPFPLNFKNTTTIRDLIASMKRGELVARRDA